MHISRVDGYRCRAGECPLWDARDQALYLADIASRKMIRYRPDTAEWREWDVPGAIGSLALRTNGGGLLALKSGFHGIDFDTGRIEALYPAPDFDPRCRTNDGKVDRLGRFVVGAMDSKARDRLGGLFSLENGQCRAIARDIGISNGPCWSPDNTTLYCADTMHHCIYAYDYDLDTGRVDNRREFANTRQLGGLPDGATVDSDGRLWSAICNGGKVVAYRPDGKLERVIEMPTRTPSSVTFGGLDLDQLYVTSLNPAAIAGTANDNGGDGAIYVIEGLGVTGLPEPRCAA